MRSLLLIPIVSALAASHAGHSSKRGLALISSTSASDVSFLVSENSSLSWYYTWSPYASAAINSSSSVVFFPLLHGVDTVEDPALHDILSRAPAPSTHILTFNEPDHGTEDGGSDISPADAAKAYIEHVVPLRDPDNSSGRRWNISHPSVTGSGKGIDWLRDFNSSCYDIDPKHGCPTDFIAVHYYGDFPGLTGHLAALRDFYGGNATATAEPDMIPPMYITEMAFAGEDAEANVAMLNQSMAYLDDKDWIAGYAWFGAFREDDANGWTGKGVSMLDDDGGLTTLGAEYLGGKDSGFEVGVNSLGNVFKPEMAFMLFGICLFTMVAVL